MRYIASCGKGITIQPLMCVRSNWDSGMSLNGPIPIPALLLSDKPADALRNSTKEKSHVQRTCAVAAQSRGVDDARSRRRRQDTCERRPEEDQRGRERRPYDSRRVHRHARRAGSGTWTNASQLYRVSFAIEEHARKCAR